MNYLAIDQSSTSNGTGFRVVLWVAGCSHHCPGCHNPESWNPVNGKEFNEETEELILNMVDKPYISGITFSGGDPLFCSNIQTISKFIKKFRDRFGSTKSIWLYTGYTLKSLGYVYTKNTDVIYILNNIDILVDGPFILKDRDTTLAWRGSPNQNIYKIENGNAILVTDEFK